jgi:hypothetical protein
MAEEGIHATIGIAQLPSDARTWIDGREKFRFKSAPEGDCLNLAATLM